MKLLPLDRPELFELVAGWLARKENHQWLDFGNGRQIITPALLKIMAQRGTHFLRAFTSDRDDIPIGILGLNSVDRTFKTAMFWGVSGEKSFRNRGYSNFASSRFLTLAFRDLGLHAVNTWAVDHNPTRGVERLPDGNSRVRYSSTVPVKPKRRCIWVIAVRPISLVRSSSPASAAIYPASSATSPGAYRKPFWPTSAISAAPPILDRMTGSPMAIASSAAFENVSTAFEVTTNASATFRKGRTSSAAPAR